MPQLQYKHFRILIAMYVSIIVSSAATTQNAWLALFGVLSGMLVLALLRRKMQVRTSDEMLDEVAGKASRAAYGIILIVFALLSLLFTFTRDQSGYISALGMIFSYLTLSMIAVYSIAFHFYQRKYL